MEGVHRPKHGHTPLHASRGGVEGEGIFDWAFRNISTLDDQWHAGLAPSGVSHEDMDGLVAIPPSSGPSPGLETRSPM